MNQDIAIRVQGLIKVYKLYDEPIDRLKEALNPFKKKYHNDFYALNNINFEVKKGETIGIIGKNGSGKSTLLKIITGVLTPTAGTVDVNGKISALLELGAGFNPEFTGIQNIYLNGAIMGYSKEEMDKRLDSIIDFADIGEFINQPVKIYSSGMYVRLAFAVAINVEPDILIVDEALSVGDMRFQKKCMGKIDSIKGQGKTIIFCSHDMHAINELCDTVLWVKEGQIAELGTPSKAISAYVSTMTESSTSLSFRDSSNKNPNFFIRNSEEVIIKEVKLFSNLGEERNTFYTGEDLVFEIYYDSLHGIDDPNYSVIIFRNDKVPIGICKTNYSKNISSRGWILGIKQFNVILKNIQLNQGKYTFGISIWDKANMISYANNITKEFEIRSLKVVYGPNEEKCAYFPEVEWIVNGF